MMFHLEVLMTFCDFLVTHHHLTVLYNLSKQDRNRLRATDLRLEGGVSSIHDLLQLVDFGDLLLFSGKVVFVENC